MVSPDSLALGLVAFGGVVAFVLAFSLGANDVSNALGTSVGSKAITIRRALMIAAVFELLGASTMGTLVSSTLKTALVSPHHPEFAKSPQLFALGMFCTLCGSAVWLVIATLSALPVSTTQTIVGGILAFASIQVGYVIESGAHSFGDVNWKVITNVLISWVASPVLGGSVALGVYATISYFILRSRDPYSRGLTLIPYYYGFSLAVLTGVTTQSFINIYKWSYWILLIVPSIFGVVAFLLCKFLIVPWHIKSDHRHLEEATNTLTADLDESSTFNPVLPSSRSPSIYPSIFSGEFYEGVSRAMGFLPIIPSVFSIFGAWSSVGTKKPGIPLCFVSICLLVYFTFYFSLHDRFLAEESHYTQARSHVDDDANVAGSEELSEDSTDGSTQQSMQSPNNPDKVNNRELIELSDSDSGNDSVEPRLTNCTADDELLRKDLQSSESMFKPLMILSAIFIAFAHGANDVSNAVAPYAALVEYFETRTISVTSEIPVYLVVLGGIGIDIGLAVLGYKVIQTIEGINVSGEKIVKLSFTRGFAAQLSAAFTVVLGTALGMPVSTTSILIGAVVGSGLIKDAENSEGVNWWMMLKIALGWLGTLVVGYILTAIFYLGLRYLLI